MIWNRKIRARLAKVVWDKSVEIDNKVRASCSNLGEYTGKRDQAIPLYFEGIGFRRAFADEWVFDPTHNHPALFKPRGGCLFFVVCNQVVMKIDKDKAAKMLVLGLP